MLLQLHFLEGVKSESLWNSQDHEESKKNGKVEKSVTVDADCNNSFIWDRNLRYIIFIRHSTVGYLVCFNQVAYGNNYSHLAFNKRFADQDSPRKAENLKLFLVYIKCKTEAGGKYSEDESTEKNEKN